MGERRRRAIRTNSPGIPALSTSAWITSLEKTVFGRLESSGDLAEQFRKMDEHMVALRNTESVNQRLFDSLHQELKKYRDNFLHESLQKPFIRDLLILFDDLSALSAQLQTARWKATNPNAAIWRTGGTTWRTPSIRP